MSDLVEKMQKAMNDRWLDDLIIGSDCMDWEDIKALLTEIERLRVALEGLQVRRETLADGREHLTVTNEFQSDKYLWCPAGFVPLKITDPMAKRALSDYAILRHSVDKEFSRDLLEALLYAKALNPDD